ncbi:MAG: DUF4339 domain-containing protein [Planctomycetota bacterium]|jgi:hypothetical protein
MYLLIAIIFGVICALIAHHKGRNPIGWFFIGFFTGIIGIIISLVVPNLKEAEQKHAHVQMEQRRLREQLRQERLKNEQFRKYTQVRLDTHDEALKIDTRHIGPLLEEANVRPILENGQELSEEAVYVEADARRGGWYYQEGDAAVGPFALEKLKQLVKEGKIGSLTYVWHESLDEWTAASRVSELGMETDRG